MARNVTIANLAEVAAARAARPAAMRPHKVNGRWRMPSMKARAIARLRRAHVTSGRVWPWDVPHKQVVKRVPFKGHLRQARAVEKREEIARCMQRMPALVERYRAEKRGRKPLEGIRDVLEVTAEEVERRGKQGGVKERW